MDSIPPLKSVALCGSMKIYDQILAAAHQLEQQGLVVYMFSQDEPVDYQTLDPLARADIKHQLITAHLDKIKQADAILVYNQTIDDKVNYIGSNTLLEMGFALAFAKKIFLLNPIPDQPNTDEIIGMLPTVIHGDLTQII